MLVLVRSISILIVAVGIVFLLSPKALKQFIAFLGQGKKLYLVGVMRIVIAVILLLGASQCRFVGIVTTLGIVILAGGIFIFALGLERLKPMLDWFNKRSLLALRLMSLVALAFGALLIYSA